MIISNKTICICICFNAKNNYHNTFILYIYIFFDLSNILFQSFFFYSDYIIFEYLNRYFDLYYSK